MYKLVILILVESINNVFSWHAYNHLKRNDDIKCKIHDEIHYNTNITEMFHKYRLWPGLYSNDAKSSDLLYGSNEEFQKIWKNQHPKDCSKAKFLICNNWDGIIISYSYNNNNYSI